MRRLFFFWFCLVAMVVSLFSFDGVTKTVSWDGEAIVPLATKCGITGKELLDINGNNWPLVKSSRSVVVPSRLKSGAEGQMFWVFGDKADYPNFGLEGFWGPRFWGWHYITLGLKASQSAGNQDFHTGQAAFGGILAYGMEYPGWSVEVGTYAQEFPSDPGNRFNPVFGIRTKGGIMADSWVANLVVETEPSGRRKSLIDIDGGWTPEVGDRNHFCLGLFTRHEEARRLNKIWYSQTIVGPQIGYTHKYGFYVRTQLGFSLDGNFATGLVFGKKE